MAAPKCQPWPLLQTPPVNSFDSFPSQLRMSQMDWNKMELLATNNKLPLGSCISSFLMVKNSFYCSLWCRTFNLLLIFFATIELFLTLLIKICHWQKWQVTPQVLVYPSVCSAIKSIHTSLGQGYLNSEQRILTPLHVVLPVSPEFTSLLMLSNL